jgi:hypothetical protein
MIKIREGKPPEKLGWWPQTGRGVGLGQVADHAAL